MKNKNHIKKALDGLFNNSNEEQDFQFEEMVINSDVMQVVADLMKKNNIKTKAELAEKLNVTKAYISKLFSSDKFFNVRLLAQLQRVFDVKFQLMTSDMLKELQKKSNTTIERNIWVFSEYQKVLVKSKSNVDVTTKSKENRTIQLLNNSEKFELETLINSQ